MSLLVGVLVALAVSALAGPCPRRGVVRGSRGGGSAGPPGVPVPVGDGSRRRRGPRPWSRHRASAPSPGDDDLAGLLHAVAAQVRAGLPPAAAWRAALGAGVDGEVPAAELLTAVVGDRGGERSRVRAVVAGAHVAAETGAPLADVLEDLAEAVAADAEQSGEIAAALAGPRATARVLTFLPALGLLVGAAMGARPWQVLTDGALGSVLGLVGVGLVVVGRLWVGALLRRAGAP
ncbi:type II secretion system F family protein [Cellulomonas wangsupingiae]|uniref:Type II secretion system F family protein n=1 Tax=Cellulomonas wangsupingiae TaxID=2968085 RepID=A0ABY5K3E3_9CELL|nr:type II secretion system F family protein [Cellulomonas wangsupingiae]MCC2335521.1 type II secretion system F family protein [Cellulomonas wangsupingiae]MCM0639949.1 type II secretion system F family protein [Cellulomonas wangsupingiae]UUI64308.1 type II secretion system F family protein [Cellulomonas wangsupingiae]